MSQVLDNLKQLDLQIFRSISTHPNLQSLEGMEFHSSKGHIRLKGQVGSYFEKQMAQETIRTLDKNRVIENELVVQW